jgi:tetratricopeptide (TPR) repeat protein
MTDTLALYTHDSRAREWSSRAGTLRERFSRTGDISLIDEAMVLDREVIELRPFGHPCRAISCGNLAHDLWLRFYRTGGPLLLEEAIILQREAMELYGTDHQDRDLLCDNLALLLFEKFQHAKNESVFNEIRDRFREALAKRPLGHPERSRSMGCLISYVLLDQFHQLELNDSRRDEANAILDEILCLLHELHGLSPQDEFHADLATLLRVGFDECRADQMFKAAQRMETESNMSSIATVMTPEISGPLDDYLTAQRQVPDMRPSVSLRCMLDEILARLFQLLYYRTSDAALLSRSIHYNKAFFVSSPLIYRRRAIMSSFLAFSLKSALNIDPTEVSYFEEAIAMERDAVELWPVDYPYPTWLYGNLIRSLLLHADQTGDDSLIDEAITLGRKAYHLTPADHDTRSDTCINLASALNARFGQTGEDVQLLNEIIRLEREAVGLHSVGHYDRDRATLHLTSSLVHRFQLTGDVLLLDESMALIRECLGRWPANEFYRGSASGTLSRVLVERFNISKDMSLIDEGRIVLKDFLDNVDTTHPHQWRILVQLIDLHINPSYASGDIPAALQYLRQAISLNTTFLPRPKLLKEVAALLQHFVVTDMKKEVAIAVLQLYADALDLVPMVAGFVLDYASQLRYLTACQTLGPGAYLVANRVGNIELGLQLLERARGVVWSQSLYLRDPVQRGAPPVLVAQLEELLRRVSKSQTSRTSKFLSRLEDWGDRHKQNNSIQAIIRAIRAGPELEDFMRGPKAEELKFTAASHPVVVLVTGGNKCYALIIRSPYQDVASIQLEEIQPSELQSLSFDSFAHKNRGTELAPEDGVRMGIRKSRSMSPLLHSLAKIWRTIVKPVLIHIGLSVCSHLLNRVISTELILE